MSEQRLPLGAALAWLLIASLIFWAVLAIWVF
jgi:hypothetical protein